MRRPLGVILALTLALVPGCAPPESAHKAGFSGGTGPEVGTGAESSREEAAAEHSPGLGNGYLVWESNRSRDWRIWTRALEPSAPRLLTPDERDRQHCCPHISPDGHWVTYLSLPSTVAGYGKGGIEGTLHLIRPDGTGGRILADSVRSSWENRAVVWRNADELIYIRGDGATVLHDLRAGRTELLAADASGTTWLINSRLSHAVSGVADFSTYHRNRAATSAIAKRTTYGGCQPYFSHDGRWGFWAAGAGGPINRIDLLTREVSTVLSKSDSRIPDGLGYAYFPMFSRDGRLFTFAASDDQHDHFQADYEIFVAESDPETLELLGDAVRMTSHPDTDRFPDVFLAPLELGRHRGEVPFAVAFTPDDSPDDSEESTTWDFGDGTTAVGPAQTHTFERPGRYEINARRSSGSQETLLRGQVVAQPAAPPMPVGVQLREAGRTVVVQFDEEIAVDRPRLRFESGVKVVGWSLGAEGRSLIIKLADRIEGFDRLDLDGVSDRAQSPNRIAPLALEIEPPLWPSDRRGLAFLWETGETANLIWDPELDAERSSSLTGSKRAFLDHDFAMVLDGGRFAASAADADSVVNACQKSNELSLEVVLSPETATTEGLRRIISFSGGTPRSRNFVLGQRGDRLVFRPRAGNPAPDTFPEVELARLPTGERSHILISYRAGRLTAFLNGESILETDAVQGGFFHWRRRPFLFGDGPRGGQTWRGTVEGIAIYSRFIEADEALENYLRYRRQLARRPTVPRLVVEATPLARSEPPSLEEITPYREALAVFEYKIDRVVEGAYSGEIVHVAHWSILDGRILGTNRRSKIGDSLRLTLEPFADNRQLESLYVADTLESASTPLFYAVPH
ncbi:MAG: PKD domain-containing protein [Acidobacteria bacterium]|nr:PKD domain-containing protein [Acidobacteriota bacterium]